MIFPYSQVQVFGRIQDAKAEGLSEDTVFQVV